MNEENDIPKIEDIPTVEEIEEAIGFDAMSMFHSMVSPDKPKPEYDMQLALDRAVKKSRATDSVVKLTVWDVAKALAYLHDNYGGGAWGEAEDWRLWLVQDETQDEDNE